MRHTNDNISDAIVDAAIDQCFHARHQRFATFEAETFIIGVFGGKESFEARTPYQSIQDSSFIVYVVFVWGRYFDTVPDPIALFSVLDMDILHAVRSTIYLLTCRNDLSQGHLLPALGREPWKDAGA